MRNQSLLIHRCNLVVTLFSSVLCTVALVQLSIFVEVTRTVRMDLCSIQFVLTFLWFQQSYRLIKRSIFCVFLSPLFCQNSIGCLTWWVCLPVLQARPDDGFIELRNLPLQHGPQALSQPVVVLLQLLLVLFLVKCDQVLILLNCLTTPAERIGQKEKQRRVESDS